MAAVYEGARDFVLFPKDHVYHDDILCEPEDSFAAFCRSDIVMDPPPHFSLPDRNPYVSYPAVSSYPSAPVYFDPSHPQFDVATKGTDSMSGPRPTPSASPSSMSQTYDHPPSILSSASGASAQSTSSSVEGSPYIHAAQPMQEKWSDSSYGLGINPQDANHDFLTQNPAARGYPGNPDIPLDPTRYSGYVGEYRANLSNFLAQNESSASSTVSASGSQDFSVYSTSPITHPRDLNDPNVTIDTVLEEARNTSGYWPSQSPTASTPLTAGSTASSPRQHLSASPVEVVPFRPPSAPASAISSPRHPFPTRPVNSLSRHYAPYPSHRQSSVPSSLSHQRQKLFFTQTSGRIVAPLQSSCRLPYSCSVEFDRPMFLHSSFSVSFVYLPSLKRCVCLIRVLAYVIVANGMCVSRSFSDFGPSKRRASLYGAPCGIPTRAVTTRRISLASTLGRFESRSTADRGQRVLFTFSISSVCQPFSALSWKSWIL